MTETAMNEERIIEIEIKLTRQEDLVDELNKIVYQQQQRIDNLAEVIAALARRLAEAGIQGNEMMPISERPPHY
jgi:SlyX protein